MKALRKEIDHKLPFVYKKQFGETRGNGTVQRLLFAD